MALKGVLVYLINQACYAVLQSWASKKFMTGWYGK